MPDGPHRTAAAPRGRWMKSCTAAYCDSCSTECGPPAGQRQRRDAVFPLFPRMQPGFFETVNEAVPKYPVLPVPPMQPAA